VAQLKWDEIDTETRTWCIPASRSKNGLAHVVHLSERALSVIGKISRTSDYVFATSRSKHFQSFAKAKDDLDDMCGIRGGGCTICGGPSYLAWPAWECRHTLQTRSSTTDQAQFQEWLPSINAMTFLPSARMLLSGGAPTLPVLCETQKQPQLYEPPNECIALATQLP
jgi:hypothetical protein